VTFNNGATPYYITVAPRVKQNYDTDDSPLSQSKLFYYDSSAGVYDCRVTQNAASCTLFISNAILQPPQYFYPKSIAFDYKRNSIYMNSGDNIFVSSLQSNSKFYGSLSIFLPIQNLAGFTFNLDNAVYGALKNTQQVVLCSSSTSVATTSSSPYTETVEPKDGSGTLLSPYVANVAFDDKGYFYVLAGNTIYKYTGAGRLGQSSAAASVSSGSLSSMVLGLITAVTIVLFQT